MENENPIMETDVVKKNNKKNCLMFFLVAALIIGLVVIVSTILVLNSPKIKARLLLLRTQAVSGLFEPFTNNEYLLKNTEDFEYESSTSELVVDIKNLSLPDLLLEPIQLNDVITIKASNDSESGNSKANFEINLEGMEIFNSDFFLSADDLILKSDYLINTYVLDVSQVQNEVKIVESTELSDDAKTIQQAFSDIAKKVLIKFPFNFEEKGKKDLEILHKDQNVKYLKFSLNQEEYIQMISEIRADIKENQALENALENIVQEYLNQNGQQLSQSLEMDITTDDIDIYNTILSLLSDATELDLDFYNLTIFYDKFKPIAYQFDLEEDDVELQLFIIMADNNDGKQFSIHTNINSTQIDFDAYEIEQEYEYTFKGDYYEIGKFDMIGVFDYQDPDATNFNINFTFSDYMLDFEEYLDIEGDNLHTDTEDSFNFNISFYDEYYELFNIKMGGTTKYESNKTKNNFMITSIIDESIYLDVLFQSESINKEDGHQADGTLRIDFNADGQEGNIELGYNSSVKDQDSVKVIMPSYNKNANDVVYYDSQSGYYEYENFIMTLIDDFENYLYYLGF